MHLVFKSHEISWRRCRPQIAALLKPDLYREGIDGEAVDWACERMQGCGGGRRLLLVISDGCPRDAATQIANDPSYLEHHLRDVVLRRERRGGVEIYGIGVGLDLGAYYSRSVAFDLTTLHGNGALREILGMIARRGRR
ncbi:aerobic cobaltochelatase subunit CobT [mine drainage metagenome]|uniref:Aerobic cobaltochelatase subunit CobT n=1 Tax=mine drainage metagenome TaxID=410659 RepID=A0A1J5PQY5_9ZZZZ